MSSGYTDNANLTVCSGDQIRFNQKLTYTKILVITNVLLRKQKNNFQLTKFGQFSNLPKWLITVNCKNSKPYLSCQTLEDYISARSKTALMFRFVHLIYNSILQSIAIYVANGAQDNNLVLGRNYLFKMP